MEIKDSELVIYEFYDPCSESCSRLTKNIDAVLNGGIEGVLHNRIDVTEISGRELARKEGVFSVPQVMVYRAGEIVDRFLGVGDQDYIRQMLIRNGVQR